MGCVFWSVGPQSSTDDLSRTVQVNSIAQLNKNKSTQWFVVNEKEEQKREIKQARAWRSLRTTSTTQPYSESHCLDRV